MIRAELTRGVCFLQATLCWLDSLCSSLIKFCICYEFIFLSLGGKLRLMYRSSDGVVTLALPDCALNTTDPGSVKHFRVPYTLKCSTPPQMIHRTPSQPHYTHALVAGADRSCAGQLSCFHQLGHGTFQQRQLSTLLRGDRSVWGFFFHSTLDSSCVNLHRADRASQEVRQLSGIVYPVNFRNKTSCDDSDLQPKKVGNINNKHT